MIFDWKLRQAMKTQATGELGVKLLDFVGENANVMCQIMLSNL